MTKGVRQEIVPEDLVREDVVRKERTADEEALLSSCMVVLRPSSLRPEFRPERKPTAAPASPRSAG
jgi:hypothetical protein